MLGVGWQEKTSNEATRQKLDRTETIMDIIRTGSYCFSDIPVTCRMIDW